MSYRFHDLPTSHHHQCHRYRHYRRFLRCRRPMKVDHPLGKTQLPAHVSS